MSSLKTMQLLQIFTGITKEKENIGSISIKYYIRQVINIQVLPCECTSSFSLQWNIISASTRGSGNSRVITHLPDTHVY